MPKSRARFVALIDLVARRADEPRDIIEAGGVVVDGRVIANPRARVRADAAIRIVSAARLRGGLKLAHALETFAVEVTGRVAVDVGASTGGFTTALLDRGAARVYAIDAGTGQLLGRLRLDARVVNLENRNLGAITTGDVPEPAEVITVDLSYLSLADAIPQLERLAIADDADLVALVKPTFELRLRTPPTDPLTLRAAVDAARSAIGQGPWHVIDDIESPITGAGGSREFFVHARRAGQGLRARNTWAATS